MGIVRPRGGQIAMAIEIIKSHNGQIAMGIVRPRRGQIAMAIEIVQPRNGQIAMEIVRPRRGQIAIDKNDPITVLAPRSGATNKKSFHPGIAVVREMRVCSGIVGLLRRPDNYESYCHSIAIGLLRRRAGRNRDSINPYHYWPPTEAGCEKP